MFQPHLNAANGEIPHSHIWKRKWQGPFRVVATNHKGNQDVYTIRDDETKREWTVNVHKLRTYNSRRFLNDTPIVSEEAPSHVDVRLDEVVPTCERTPVVANAESSVLVDVDVPKRSLLSSQTDLEPMTRPHPSEHRHRTGISKKEALRRQERMMLDAMDSNENPEQPRSDQGTSTLGSDKEDVLAEGTSLDEYEVEDVLAHRRNGSAYQYLVKWKIFSADHNAWLNQKQFVTKGCLNDYWLKHPISARPRAFKKLGVKSSSKKKKILAIPLQTIAICSSDPKKVTWSDARPRLEEEGGECCGLSHTSGSDKDLTASAAE